MHYCILPQDPSVTAANTMRAMEAVVETVALDSVLVTLLRSRLSPRLDSGRAQSGSASHKRPLLDERERTALVWVDVLAFAESAAALEIEYTRLRRHFDEDEISELTVAIVALNEWRRAALELRPSPLLLVIDAA